MKRVIVSVTNNLVTDQRVERVCQSLFEWGFDVLLIGRSWPNNTAIERPYHCKRFRLLFNRKFLFYAEYNLRLFFYLLFHKADILLSNDLDTLPANYLAAKIKGCKLFFDSHEYFPQTPEVYQRKQVRNFWQLIEKALIRGCHSYYTVSGSIAAIYLKKYNIRFAVIRNVPLRYNLPDTTTNSESVILYQGTLNIGRGLELMIAAMQFIHSGRLIIAGDGPEREKLNRMVNSLQLYDKIQFTGFLMPDELRKVTVRATVGISIEEPMGESYKSALPNKLFDYIQAGLPVLVSDLKEMKAIVDQYQVGMILEDRTPENLASVLNGMLHDEVKRSVWKKNLSEASKELCWERESLKLMQLFQEGLST